MTVILHPEGGTRMLDTYADLLDSAGSLATITLPFNLDERFEEPSWKRIRKAIRYVMLERAELKQSDAAKRFNPDPDVVVTRARSRRGMGAMAGMKFTVA